MEVLDILPGLGDMLAALPVAYAMCEGGRMATVRGRASATVPDATLPDIADLPHLPLVGDAGEGQRWSLQAGWNWLEDPLRTACARVEAVLRTTPQTACLVEPVAEEGGRSGDVPTRLPREYALVCGEGRYLAQAKALSEQQLAAVRDALHGASMPVVRVGDAVGECGAQADYDLRGKTSIRELCALVSGAAVVVSAETGLMHLAGAYSRPCVAIVPAGTKPVSTLRRYAPVIALEAARAGLVAEADIKRAVQAACRAARVRWAIVGGEREVCGVQETASRVAEAAGVECLLAGSGDPGEWAVVEYAHGLGGSLAGRDPEKTVISCHIWREEMAGFPYVLFRGHAAYLEHQTKHRWARYVPLPTLCNAAGPMLAPAKGGPVTFAWHGMVSWRKGLRELVAAFRVAQKQRAGLKLLLLGSYDAPGCDGMLACELVQQEGDGLECDFRPCWRNGELRNRLAAADCYVYPDTIDKEQSAAVADVLGFGRPVLTSARTAHDDTRGWCWTMGADMEQDLLAVIGEYEQFARRAWLGGSYRTADLIARSYRAAVGQCVMDGWDGNG